MDGIGAMRDFQSENLSHDAVHGYIPFGSGLGTGADEVSERDIIDDPWIQRLRQIANRRSSRASSFCTCRDSTISNVRSRI